MRAAIVLAAGKGTRMRSNRPKLLHLLLGAPLLEYPLRLAEKVGVDRVCVVIGHGRDAIRSEYSERGIVWAVQEEQLGTGHAAHVGLEALMADLDYRKDGGDAGDAARPEDLSVLVLNGDLPLLRADTICELFDRHEAEQAAASLLTCVKSDPYGFGRILRDEKGCVERIVEEPDADEATKSIPEVNVGTYVFRASELEALYSRTTSDNEQGEFYLPDVVVLAAGQDRDVVSVSVEDETDTAQVNSLREMAIASEILRARILDEFMDSGVTIDDPRSTYIEPGVEIGRDTRIHPFTVIRRGVVIGERCEVGPFAHLRVGTELIETSSVGNFVEVKKARIGKRTKAKHLTYIGDGDIGEDVNIGAGTIFANYDGKTKSLTVIKDGAFIGSGTILVAPVTVGMRAVTGAGAVVTKGRDIGDDEVVVGVPAKLLSKKN